MDGAFERSEAVLGAEKLVRIASANVLLVGVGGVGSWCAEALVRTGLRRITIVDDDLVAPSNLNRQCPATSKTIGAMKVEAMKTRLLEINPGCAVTALAARFPEGVEGSLRTASGLQQERTAREWIAGFDLVVDAIDSVDCKAELILAATEAGVPIVSSMGAALRTDPTKVAVRRFDKVEGDGLARALRQRFRKLERFPAAKFNCVCSSELPLKSVLPGEPKGSLMTVTAAFGMALAAEALKAL